MRSDLNKTLCERPRANSSEKFHRVRRSKKFSTFGEEGELLLSQEGMKRRYGENSKNFSDNLSPLYGQVRKAIGRKWDSLYSELCKNFDMSTVINKHILQHLEQFCEKNLVLKGKDLYVRGGYGADILLKYSSAEFYVDPRDGIIKKNKFHLTYKKKEKARRQIAEAEERKKFVRLDKENEFRCIDGTWFHFSIKIAPMVEEVYEKPALRELFKDSWSARERTWDQLSVHERERWGIKKLIGKPAQDVYTLEKVYSTKKHIKHYYAIKKTASNKMLKKAGII